MNYKEEKDQPVETPPAPEYPKYILLRGEDGTGVICKLSTTAINKVAGEYAAISQGLIAPMRALFTELTSN